MASKNLRKLNFAIVDASKLAFLASPLGLESDRFPAFVIHDIQSDETHPFGQDKDITEESIEAFVDEFLARNGHTALRCGCDNYRKSRREEGV